MNFLEQLAAEWYQYKGYFVRTNIKFGRRSRGGWEGEMDVVAYDPNNQEFLHIETSTDAKSHQEREIKFKKKFSTAKPYYRRMFPFKGSKLKQIAILGFNRPKVDLNFGEGVEVLSIPEFLNQITNELSLKNPAADAIPETYPLLRAIQYSAFYKSRQSR
jgi:hypothetical protein